MLLEFAVSLTRNVSLLIDTSYNNNFIPVAKPTNVSVSAQSSTSLRVSWSAQENNCFNYQISCFSDSSGIVSTTTQPTSRSALITGTQPNTTYQCCVRATATTILGPETCDYDTTDRRSECT